MNRHKSVLFVLIVGLLVLPTLSYAQLGVKDLNVGDAVDLSGVRITAIGGTGGITTDYGYIEDANRIEGARFYISSLTAKGVGIGDEITISGTIAQDTIGKYINIGTIEKTGAYVPLEAYAMNNTALAEENARGLFVLTWGKVKSSSTTYFTINDGGSTQIKVYCGSMTKPTVGQVVRVRGIAGGTNLYMRREYTDWVYASSEFHALPLPGKYRYPREWLVLGPFKDASHTNDYELLDVDFIKAYTGIDEYAATPKAGDTVGGNTWTRVKSQFDILPLDSVLAPADVEHAVIYVHLYIWSQTEGPSVYMNAGCNDWFRVWLNGDDPDNTTPEILRIDQGDCSTGRGVVFGDDGPFAITLHAGLNSLMFKIVNQTDLTGLCCQFTQYTASSVRGYGGFSAYTATGLGYVLNSPDTEE
ncbi:hypothetical protein LLG46_08430 [bacterium]|nr:hypothetical protein [bacterium]